VVEHSAEGLVRLGHRLETKRGQDRSEGRELGDHTVYAPQARTRSGELTPSSLRALQSSSGRSRKSSVRQAGLSGRRLTSSLMCALRKASAQRPNCTICSPSWHRPSKMRQPST